MALLSVPEREALEAAARALDLPLVLVGGAVRDALMGRPVTDWDLVVPGPTGASELARAFARATRRPMVALDPGFGVYRVGGADGLVFDFTRQQAERLEDDLLRRDFTLNAIALGLEGGELHDPTGGKADLEAGVIRMVAPRSLTDDPARLARAYRFAAQLGFAIEPGTRAALVRRLGLLKGTANERVLVEVGKWLEAPAAREWVLAAASDGFWTAWLAPEGGPTPQAPEPLAARWDALEACRARHPEAQAALEAPLGGGFSALGASRLALVFPAAGEAAALERLPMSAKLRSVLGALLGPDATPWPAPGEPPAERRWGYHRWLKALGPAAVPRLVASAAAGAVPEAIAGEALAFARAREREPFRPLVGGKALMQALGLPPGPAVGAWLARIEERQVKGAFAGPDEALAWLAEAARRGE